MIYVASYFVIAFIAFLALCLSARRDVDGVKAKLEEIGEGLEVELDHNALCLITIAFSLVWPLLIGIKLFNLIAGNKFKETK